MVELGHRARPGRHQPAAVEQDHDLLAALRLQLHRHRLVAPCGGLPVDPAGVVARYVVAQAGEGGRRARRPGPALAGPVGHAPAESQLVLPDRQHVRVNSRPLWCRQPDLACPPAAPAPDPEIDGAEIERSPLGRVDRVDGDPLAAAVEAAPNLAPIRMELVRDMVRQHHLEACGAAVPGPDQDLLPCAERERVGQVAPGFPADPGRQGGRVADDQDHQDGVVGDRRQPEPGTELGERDEDGTDAGGDQQAGAREQPAEAVADPSQRGGVTWAMTASRTLSEVLPATSASG